MKKFIRNTSTFTLVALATFVAVSVFSPVKKSNADEFDVGVNVSSVISLSTASDSVMMSAPVGGGFTSGNTSAIVLTNSAYGYTLAIEDTDSNTSMTSSGTEDEVSSNYLGSKTEDTLEENTWGFSVDGTKFYAIPKKNNPLILSKAMLPTSDDGATTTLTFGVKTYRYLTSGTYTNRIILTAYTNGVDGNPEGVDPSSDDPEELSDDFPEPYEEGEGTNENRLVLAKSMQDPKLKQYCANSYTPTYLADTSKVTRYFDGNYAPRATVKDKRDGNKYTITKLADGKCWMTTNLSIINKTITPDDSDVASNYAIPDGNLAAFSGFDSNSVMVDSTYGGYYTWYVATAGSGAGAVTGTAYDAPYSICPKGWALPTTTQYLTLSDAYGSYPGSRSVLFRKPEFANVMWGGHIYYSYMNGTGASGFYWSASTPADGNSRSVGDYLSVGDGVFTMMGDLRTRGLNIHCVLR